ncbi:MAG TPA: TSUP family transporter [Burkholderiales bacterium]|nr:TSUP family transporter [Burkholderiales bacterium]
MLLDVSTALALGVRFSSAADRSELLLLAPCSLAGAVSGVTLLVTLPRSATLAGFGAFLLGYGAYALAQGEAAGRVARAWGALAGFTGGAMGTLFGVGAPPYAIYLARRLSDKAVLRATLSNIVLLSTTIRALVFLASGLMLADRIVGYALLLPFALGGLALGNRFHGRISRAALLKLISVLLALIGLSLLYRALA